MIYSKGISWFNDARIPFKAETILLKGYTGDKWQSGEHKQERVEDKINTQGRFPPNLLVSDDMLNDGTISTGNKKPRVQNNSRRYGENNFTNGGLYTPEGHITPTYNDKGTSSRFYDLDLWFSDMIQKIT